MGDAIVSVDLSWTRDGLLIACEKDVEAEVWNCNADLSGKPSQNDASIA